MLKFYTVKGCPGCSEIQDVLSDMTIAHEVIVVDKIRSFRFEDNKTYSLPVLIDDTKIIPGIKNIHKHLQKLKIFKSEWDRFQSDSCYCNERGETE